MDLIRTRLHPPTRGAGLIQRDALDAMATRALHRRLIFVQAPAGYGKSSQLHRWHAILGSDNISTGWLSMDQSTDDLRSFFYYMTSAIREQLPHFATDFLTFIDNAGAPTATRVATAFINEVLGVDRQIVLFIDDFHLLTDSEAQRALEHVLQDAPGNFHLVVASRQSLTFSLARLRMLGEIDEIDSEQLRFDETDIDEFLRLSGHEPLPIDITRKLLSATEGWAAGVQLATISLAQSDNLGPFLDRFSGENRAVSEFLIDDVIGRLPQETVDFLLRTSILELFNEDLCNTVVGTQDSDRQIENLSAQSLFIFSLDEDKIWFRYHHLFSGFLQHMLRKTRPRDVAGLHVRASDWYAQNKLVDLAFSHAIRARDWTRAATILDASCTELFYGGKLSTLLRWADQIPAETQAEFPRIQLEIAWSIILEWRFDDALAIIREVEAKLAQWKQTGAPPEAIEAVTRIVLHRRMMLALFRDDMPTLETSVLELLHDFPSEDPYLRGTLENCLIYARREIYKLDRVDRMDRWAREYFERSGSRFVMVWHEAILGPTYHLRGDTQQAEEALMAAIETAEYVDGPLTPLQAMPAMLLAEIRYEANDLKSAAALVAQFSGTAEKQGFVDNLAAYYITQIRLLLRDGALDAAEPVVAEGTAMAEFRGFSRLLRRLELERVRIAAARGDLAFLRGVLDRAETPALKKKLTPGSHTTSEDEAFALGWQTAACVLGQPRDAVAVLRRWCTFTADRGAVRSEVRCLIALAVALAVAGDHGEARRKMRTAVQKAARPRYLASFLDGGEPVLTILRDLFGSGQEPTGPVSAFGTELIRAFTSTADLPDVDGPADPEEHAPPEGLNEREREVLRLAALGKSNKEIARALGMTEGTVKWYMQQVFAKLGVRRRSLAVQRARQFGML